MWTLYAARPDSVPVIRCSPPSWAAHAALEQASSPYQLEWLRFDAGEHRSGRVLALNPAGTLPVLTDGARVWTDTVEILQQITREAEAPASPRLQLATAVKVAGMASLRARMKSEHESSWAPLQSALQDWEQLAGATDDDPLLDAAGLLSFAYATTASWLGLALHDLPKLAAWLARQTRRRALQATWPSTWPRPG